MSEKDKVLLTEILQLIESAQEKTTQLDGADTHAISNANDKFTEAYFWCQEAAKK
jgi:hypothetical protein